MKKKVMTMVLAASMLLGMAGCGSSSANDSAAANGNTAGGDQAVAGTEKNDASGNAEGGSQEGTLTVWCWDSFNVDAMKEAGKLGGGWPEGSGTAPAGGDTTGCGSLLQISRAL